MSQTAGNNAICTSATGCTTTTGSGSFIDASVFIAQSPYFCGVVNYVLTNLVPSAGAVIDARGLNASNTTMACASGTTPWNTGTFINTSSTILLPTGTIVIPGSWLLPNGTHLIGQGDNIGFGTTIQAQSSGFSGTAMIQFGNACPTPACTAISVENLNLDGNGKTINGIVNSLSQGLSYVDHVSLYQIVGTGLSVSTGADNSGPYSNITFDTGGASGTSSTVCASINGTAATRGFRGLSCKSNMGYPPAAVLLDASNNSIEDVRIVNFYDGIRVGSLLNAQNNTLVNILGDTAPPYLYAPVYTVHIENVGNTVTDLSVVGASNSQISGTYTIVDDITSTDLVDSTVALYALGKPANGGYSRFVTSPSYPTWVTGSSAPTGSSCTKGSLYSCTGTATNCSASSTSYALWGCPSGSGWVGIK
jgi:hypothetical protein